MIIVRPELNPVEGIGKPLDRHRYGVFAGLVVQASVNSVYDLFDRALESTAYFFRAAPVRLNRVPLRDGWCRIAMLLLYCR